MKKFKTGVINIPMYNIQTLDNVIMAGNEGVNVSTSHYRTDNTACSKS